MMQKAASLLTSSTFRVPSFTRDEWEEINRRAMDREKAEAERIWHRAVDTIPRAFQRADIATTDQLVEEWAQDPTVGLLIQGEVGRGKTYSACAVLRYVLERTWDAERKLFRKSVRFTTLDNMLRECRAAYSNGDTEEQVLSRFCNVGVLCIDDLGNEKATEWSLSVLFTVIDTRYANSRPTIITTQYTGQQLLDQLTVDGNRGTAKAILSRMRDYSRAVLDGADRRGHARRN